jgi:AraC-like DNA-binding protein
METSARTRNAFLEAILAYVEEAAASRPGARGAGTGPRRGTLDLRGVASLLDATARMLGDDAVGLHFAEGFDFDALGLFSFAVLNAPTVGTALRNMERYSGTVAVGEGARLEVDERHGSLCFPVWGADPPAVFRHLDEAAVMFVLRMLRRLAGRGWSPREIGFRHAAPNDPDVHRRLLGAPVRFDQPRSRIAFAPADLDRAVRDADRFRLPIVERHLESAVSDDGDPDPLRYEIEVQVASLVCDGHPSLSTLAPRLGMSARTLQRRLDERGLCYRDLVAGVRMRIARHYLESPQPVGLAEIAFLLGYSELSAFDRAFRRWMGTSPGEYQRRSRRAGAGEAGGHGARTGRSRVV